MKDFYAVLCEGNAERAIINLLLDNDLLMFSRDQLLEEDVLKIRSAKAFEKRHLNKAMPDKITVLRILDSTSENFKISKNYQHKIEVINVITKPEVEMLIVISEGLYDDFKRKASSSEKPSQYIKKQLRHPDVKSERFIRDYFKDQEKLVNALLEYRRITQTSEPNMTLADLLKDN